LKPYSVVLSVKHLDETAKWYQTKLGFQPITAKSYPEYGVRLTFLKCNDCRIELIEDANSTPATTRLDPPQHTLMRGVCQFAFEVSDLESMHEQLSKQNVTFAWEPQTYTDLGVKFFFVRDNEGNLIQFIQRLDQGFTKG